MIHLVKLQVPYSGLRAWLLQRLSSSFVQEVVPTTLGWEWISWCIQYNQKWKW